MYDGMAKMTYRTTFALDESTALRIRELASVWNVSQAEVIRRSVAKANAEASRPDPIALLTGLHESGGGLDATQATTYLEEVAADRKQWRAE